MNLHDLRARFFNETGMKLSEDDPLLIASKLIFIILEEQNEILTQKTLTIMSRENKKLEETMAWLKDQRSFLVGEISVKTLHKAQQAILSELKPHLDEMKKERRKENFKAWISIIALQTVMLIMLAFILK